MIRHVNFKTLASTRHQELRQRRQQNNQSVVDITINANEGQRESQTENLRTH